MHLTVGFDSGMGVRRPTLPRDVGLMTTGPNAKPLSGGGVRPWSKNVAAAKWNSTSGAGRPERVVKNPKIKILYSHVVEEVLGIEEDKVTGVKVKNVKNGEVDNQLEIKAQSK